MGKGELAAIFRELARDVAQAGRRIAASVARLAEKTADNEEANLARLLQGDEKAADDIVAAGERSTAPSLGEMVTEPVRPTDGQGIARDLGHLPAGRQAHVRTVASEAELRSLYDKWSAGGTDVTPNGYNGAMVRLSDGSVIGWRNVSKSGGATIDLKLPDGASQKVHIDGR